VAQTTVNRLTDTLKVAGWRYAVAGVEGGSTVFSLIKERPSAELLSDFTARPMMR
jgi:hypothetical protein